MRNGFRTKVIKTLIDEISLLSGATFEQFGYRIMEVVHPANWVERGTTTEGAPRGYTIDTSGSGAKLVAEMSSKEDYFSGDLDKPRGDLQHIFALHPDVKRIWLLCCREAYAGETTKCANLITQFESEHQSVEGVEILDSRRIASYIFKNIEVERFVASITAYLPSIGQLSDEHAFSHRIPLYPKYKHRPVLEQRILSCLSQTSFVVITGISGIGKSAIAAKVAEELRDKFDLIIWYDAHDLNNIVSLADVDVRRAGTRHNILSLLRRHKCLLVLDDAVLSSEDLANIEYGDSKIIVTCQATTDPNAITVGGVDQGEARTLLQEGVSKPIPAEIFSRVFSSIGGYPLLLTALSRLAQEEGWGAVDACCDDAARFMEDERHVKVCQRILKRHQEALSIELDFVRWCDSPRFASELAAVCASPLVKKNLGRRGFLAATGSGDMRVHDIIFKSICAVIGQPVQREAEFSERLDRFIVSEYSNERSLLRRIAHLHAPLLRRLATSCRRPSFIYAVALVRTGDFPTYILGDPVVEGAALARLPNWFGREMELRAIIEVVEALYTITCIQHGTAAAREVLQRNIKALELLVQAVAATGEILRDIKHHHAKMLLRLQKVDEAEAEFLVLLDGDPTFAAARLQLVRIFEKKKKKDKALEHCKYILSQHQANPESVSAAVLLESLRHLASLGTAEDLTEHESQILSSVKEVREFDKGLALRLVASVASKTWYIMPDLATRVFDSIEWRDAAPAADEIFDWAQAHKAAAKATEILDPRRKEFLLAADEAYKSIPSPTSYQLVHHAEALILLEKHEEANQLLNVVGEQHREAFWWQRKAQALLGLQKGAEALSAINTGLELLPENHWATSAFLEVKFLSGKLLADPNAIEDLEKAISKLTPGDKYRNVLEKKRVAELRPL
jgi:tetratricopeptide (TPR) repeat protein